MVKASPLPKTNLRPRTRRPLGPYSYLVMRTLLELPPEQCYGLAIEEHISQRMEEEADLSQIYVTLKRLEAKYMIIGSKAKSPHGTKHKVTLYRITTAGQRAFESALPFYTRLAARPRPY